MGQQLDNDTLGQIWTTTQSPWSNIRLGNDTLGNDRLGNDRLGNIRLGNDRLVQHRWDNDRLGQIGQRQIGTDLADICGSRQDGFAQMHKS